MGLLTDIVNQKVAEKARENFAAKQAQIAFYQKAMTPEINPDPQDRAYAEQQLLKLLPPEGKQTHQRGNALANFFHNVVGHQDPPGYGNPQPSPLTQGAPKTSEDQQQQMAQDADMGVVSPSPKNALASPVAQSTTTGGQPMGDTAFSDKPAGPAGGDANLGAAPNAPQPSPAAALPPPTLPTSPTQPVGQQPPFHSLYSNNTPQKIAEMRHQMAVSAGIAPGTAAYQEILATGNPSTSITTAAKIEAEREAGQKTLQYLEQRGINVPDWMKAEVLTGKNLGASAMTARPYSENVDATNMDPQTKQELGLPAGASGKFTIWRDRYTHNPLSAEQGWAGVQNVTGENGQITTVPTNQQVNPQAAQPNVVRLLASPKIIDRQGGGKSVATGAQLLNGTSPTPIPDSLGAGDATNKSSYTSPSGQTTSSSRKGPSAARPLAAPQLPTSAAPSALPPASTVLPPAPKKTAAPPQVKPFDPSNRTDSIVQAIGNDAANWKLATNAADKYQIGQRMAQLGIEPGNVTGSMRDRAKNARLILGHLDQINSIIDQAEKDGELGVVATRWNDFLTNKLGDDPTKDHTFAKLSSELGFLSTAVAMAHGGMRGGSSPTMVEHWEKALDAKDPGTLKAKLGEARKWMQGYATLDHGMQDVAPIQLKDGRTIIPHDKAAAEALRREHPELIAQ